MDVRFVRHDVVDSTSERAFAALAEGRARHGDVHLAREQTAGRGRRGRTWHSAAGEGLYLSLVLVPPPPRPPAPALTIAAGLGVLDALRALGLAGARLKWPNDVLVGDAKLAGILVESRSPSADAGRPAYVVGVGLNVGQRSFPAELLAERPVTSLALEGLATDVERAAEAVAAGLLARARFDPAALAALEREYVERAGLARAGGAPCRVRVRGPEDREREGELVALSIADGLVVREPSGAERATPLELVRAVTRVG